MHKFSLIFLLILTASVFPQQASPIYITGSINDIAMNPTFSPDGKKIAFTKANYKGIYIYDIAAKNVKKVTDEQAAGFGYKWSNDSKSILTRVAKYEDMKRLNAVKIFDVDSDQQLQLTEYRARMPFMPEWSEQDTKVILPSKTGVEVYSSGKLNKTSNGNNSITAFSVYDKIVIEDPQTKSQKSIKPFSDLEILNFALSPDRNMIVIETVMGDMYSMNYDGSNMVDLGYGNSPKWSPDGKKIIFMIVKDDGNDFTASDIYTVNSDGTQKKNVTNTPDIIEMNPSFSSDGKRIVFDVYNDGSIYLMNIE